MLWSELDSFFGEAVNIMRPSISPKMAVAQACYGRSFYVKSMDGKSKEVHFPLKNRSIGFCKRGEKLPKYDYVELNS